MRDYRNAAAVVLALTLMQAGLGALSVVVPLALSHAGASAAAIGVVIAGYAGGFLLGAFAAPRVIREIGHIRSFAACAALAAALTLLLYADVHVIPWTLIQAGLGLCVAGLLTAGESWIADSAPTERRGALLGFYLVAAKIGLIAGPFLIFSGAPGAAGGFMVAGGLLALSLAPVAATKRAQPAPPSAEPFGPLRLWRMAPAAFMGAFIAGACNGSVLQLYSIYAERLTPGQPNAAAAAFNAALALGAMLAQWPAGLFSDRIDRRLVIGALAAAGAGASVALALSPAGAPGTLVLALAFAWGAGSLSFYGVAVAHAADRAGPGETTGMISGILIVWAIGAIVGPVAAGAVMSTPLGSSGLFWYAAATLVVLALAMVRRRAAKAAVEPGDKSAFALSPTTSLAYAELDPRGDADPQLPLFAKREPHPEET